MPGKSIVDMDEMVLKVQAVCRARRDDAFVIVARTDALAVGGIEGAVKRAKAYTQAGADMIFPDAVRTEDDVKRIVDGAGVPVTINMAFGIRNRPTTPSFDIQRLKEIGVRRISLPRMLPAASIHAMSEALKVMREVLDTGIAVNREDLLASIEDIWSLMGLDTARCLESELLGQV
jgi:2-methylisocitrate lyase-like PEP mutase family enzyme